MTNLIDRAKAHYKQLSGEPECIEVAEWGEGESPAKIYYTPFTLSERMRLGKFSDGHELAAEILILKARDESGAPLFTREHKIELMKFVDSAVIARVAKAIMGSDEAGTEEIEKN